MRSYKSSIIFEETGITNVSDTDFTEICGELQNCLNNWLDECNFRSIQHQLRNQLSPSDEIRFTIQTEHYQIKQIPWDVGFILHWKWFDNLCFIKTKIRVKK